MKKSKEVYIKRTITLMLFLNLLMLSLILYLHIRYEKTQMMIIESLTYTNIEIDKIKAFEEKILINSGYERKLDV